MSSSKVKCTCGWSWNKSDSSKKDMYICHECGRDNSNNMKNGGWLDSYADGGTMQEHQENYNDSSVSLPEGYVGEGYNTKGRNYSPAWGGQFEDGGEISMAQTGRKLSPTIMPIGNPNLFIDGSNWVIDGKVVNKPKSNARTLNIVDPRKKMATTNKPLRPNSDLVGGKYSSNHLDKLMQEAKRQGLSKQDMMNLSAMGFQETKWDKADEGNIGHTIGDWKGKDEYQDFINAYKLKMKEADRLGIKDPATRLQIYNGFGKVYPSTEKDYHGFNMKKIYGVPVPKEGIDMKKNPLYGKQVIDIRDNVLAKNPKYLQYMDSIYKAPVPKYINDPKVNKLHHDPKKHQMGGSLPGATGNFYTRYKQGGLVPGDVGFDYPRTINPAPDNGPGAKKTMASAQNGAKTKNYFPEYKKIVAKSDKEKLRESLKERPRAVVKESIQAPKLPSRKNIKESKLTKEGNITKDNKGRVVIQNEKGVYEPYVGPEMGEITQHTPQSTASKTWEVLTNPLTAVGYGVRNQRLPDNFSLGDRSNLDMATDVINPAFYINEASQFVNNTGSSLMNTAQGNFSDGAVDFLGAGLNALSIVPLAKGAKPLLNKAGRALGTESGLLSNTYKYNPFANKEVPMNKLFHGSDNPNLSLDDIKFTEFNPNVGSRPGQFKRRAIESGDPLEMPGGFYTNDRSVPKFMGNSPYRYSMEIPANSKVFKWESGVSDNISVKKLQELKNKGYDVIQGKNILGETEYIPLNKNLISNWKMYQKEAPELELLKDSNFETITPNWLKGYPEVSKQEDGGVIKDDMGQWNHPGEITEIGSPYITMEGVPYDVLGISDTGDTKLMKPGKNYKFKGKKVTEYPMAKNGIRQEQKGLVNLDQLTNFTNYNKPQPGGWLNKYN